MLFFDWLQKFVFVHVLILKRLYICVNKRVLYQLLQIVSDSY